MPKVSLPPVKSTRWHFLLLLRAGTCYYHILSDYEHKPRCGYSRTVSKTLALPLWLAIIVLCTMPILSFGLLQYIACGYSRWCIFYLRCAAKATCVGGALSWSARWLPFWSASARRCAISSSTLLHISVAGHCQSYNSTMPGNLETRDLPIVSFCTSGKALPTCPDRLCRNSLSSPVSLKIFHSIRGCSKSSSVTSEEYAWTRPTHSSCATSAGPLLILRNEERTVLRRACVCQPCYRSFAK